MPISKSVKKNIADIIGLQTALDAKSSINHTHAIALIEGLQAALDAKSPTSHSHAIALIEGLQSALDAKSPTSHSHAIALIEGLQAALDAKSPTSHSHVPEGWQSLSLATGWSRYNTAVPSPQFRKFLNLIEIKGTIVKSTSVTANEIVATIPLDYRPAEARYFITWNNNSYSRVLIEPNGFIKVAAAGSQTVVGLDIIFGLG